MGHPLEGPGMNMNRLAFGQKRAASVLGGHWATPKLIHGQRYTLRSPVTTLYMEPGLLRSVLLSELKLLVTTCYHQL